MLHLIRAEFECGTREDKIIFTLIYEGEFLFRINEPEFELQGSLSSVEHSGSSGHETIFFIEDCNCLAGVVGKIWICPVTFVDIFI